MNPGELTSVLIFKAVTSAVTNGDYTESEGASVNIRCRIKQIDGFKKMQYTELINKDTFEAICYDNSVIISGAICTYGSEKLTVHSIVRNPGKSGTNEIKIILYKK